MAFGNSHMKHCALAVLAASACANPVESAGDPAARGTSVTAVDGVIHGDLLHEIELTDDHALQFYAFGDGDYGVRETSDADAADDMVLRDATEGMGLVQIYRLAVPDAAERDIPRALIEADRELAQGAAEEPSALETADEPTVAVTTAPLLATPNPPAPTTACSADLFADNWGATWFLNNYCIEGTRRLCDTNWWWFDSKWIKSKWVKNVQLEGDFNNRGHTSAEAWWIPTGCGLFTCLAEGKVLWDYDVLPRRVEGWIRTSSNSSHEFRSTGWSACAHADFAVLSK